MTHKAGSPLTIKIGEAAVWESRIQVPVIHDDRLLALWREHGIIIRGWGQYGDGSWYYRVRYDQAEQARQLLQQMRRRPSTWLGRVWARLRSP